MTEWLQNNLCNVVSWSFSNNLSVCCHCRGNFCSLFPLLGVHSYSPGITACLPMLWLRLGMSSIGFFFFSYGISRTYNFFICFTVQTDSKWNSLSEIMGMRDQGKEADSIDISGGVQQLLLLKVIMEVQP